MGPDLRLCVDTSPVYACLRCLHLGHAIEHAIEDDLILLNPFDAIEHRCDHVAPGVCCISCQTMCCIMCRSEVRLVAQYPERKRHTTRNKHIVETL